MWGTSRELRLQVSPLKPQLTVGHRDPVHLGQVVCRAAENPVAVEAVASFPALRVEAVQIGSHCSQRLGVVAEPLQLRVAGVTARGAAQDRLGQQRLPPTGDEPLAVQKGGMKGPEPHEALSAAAVILEAILRKITAWKGVRASQ